MFETKEDNMKQMGFNLNESAEPEIESPNAELSNGIEEANVLPIENFSESGVKVVCETDSLVDDGMERTLKDGNMENVVEIKDKKRVKVKPIEREILITRRVLRSGSVARDLGNSDKHHRAVKKKGKGDDKGKVSGRSSVDEVKEVVKQEHVKSPVTEEIHGDGFGSRIKVECKDDRSDDEKEGEVKRKRGRPRKLEISSQSDDNGSISNCKLGAAVDKKEKLVGDDNDKKLIGGSCFIEEKTVVKLEVEEYVEAKEILGADFRSQVKVEIKDDRLDDENGNVEPHDVEPQVKRKRGRPRKLQISSQCVESLPNTNCKLVRTPVLSSQSSVDRTSLKRLRGRPPKTKDPAVGLYMEKVNVNSRHGSPLITPDQSMSDSIDKSRRTKSNYRTKGTESDGRKMVRKRGRPPMPQKKRKSGETDESDCKPEKRLKLRESPLESRHNSPLIAGKRRIVEQQNKQNEGGRQSISKSKKMLSERILQLLLAAGWTVEYRPRSGRVIKMLCMLILRERLTGQ